MKRYFRNIGTALTELLGAFSGITLNSNETTSGAAHRRREEFPRLRKFINKLFFWQDDHCLYSAFREIEDCLEVLDAYGYEVTPPKAIAAVRPDLSTVAVDDVQAEARDEEATAQNPEADDFDAEAWFAGLPDNAKMRILEWGVSIKMSKANRKKVARIASVWNAEGLVAPKNHGMS